MWTDDSVFVKFESCPNCGSRDNLSVWSDGHKWCFGCSYYVRPSGEALTLLRKRLEVVKNTSTGVRPILPSDASYNLSREAMTWLSEFGVSPAKAATWRFKWSEQERGLILPIYDDKDELVVYQIRYFDNSKPKYKTFGKLGNFIPVFGNFNNKIIVAVEDIISARKISEVCNATPLLGCHISTQLATRLSVVYDRLLIWLDSDKFRQAQQQMEKYRYLFDEVSSNRSVLDPKYYETQQLMEMVYECFEYESLLNEMDVV